MSRAGVEPAPYDLQSYALPSSPRDAKATLITLPFPLAFQAHGSAGLEFHGFAPDFFQRPERHISLQRHSRGFVLDKNSIFGSLTLQDFSHKVKIGEEGIRGFEGKRV